jgi:hypothetical protein
MEGDDGPGHLQVTGWLRCWLADGLADGMVGHVKLGKVEVA